MSDLYQAIVRLVQKGSVKVSVDGYEELANDGITVREVVAGISEACTVEEYPEYGKDPAILLRQMDKKKNYIHALWGIPKGLSAPAVLITAYRPEPQRWSVDCLERVK